MAEACRNCGAQLAGEFCHSCGQHRSAVPLTLKAFGGEVVRRVFRFDKAFAVTIWRMLREPGQLVSDYLSGRRSGYLDPIQYFISSVFVQFVIAALVRALAPLMDRLSATAWLGQLGGIVAVKVLTVFWMGTLWRVLFWQGGYALAEIYVFAMYAFGTTGLLWALLPVIDLLVPLPLGASDYTVASVTFAVEVGYMSYAIYRFSHLSLTGYVLRVSVVMVVGYILLASIVGRERMINLLLPPMPA